VTVSLADVMSAMRLHLFTEAAFLLASAAFAVIVVTVCLRSNRAAFERARLLPLDEDSSGRRPSAAEGDER